MDGKLLDACAVLLGPWVSGKGVAVLDDIDVAVIRGAYRRLAISCHPDAAARRGARSGDGRRFVEASQAYELVMRHLLDPRRSRVVRPSRASQRPTRAPQRPARSQRAAARPARPPRPARPAPDTPLYYRGRLPPHSLRLAEYLFYSGRISWQELIGALVWQRTIRPTFGQLARQLRYLSARDLAAVLTARLQDERTGAAAARLGLLSADQVDRILRIQRARHRPIGRYFVEKRLLPVVELTRALRDLHRHNSRCGSAA